MLHLLPSTPEDCQFFWHETDCSVNGNRFVRIKQPIKKRQTYLKKKADREIKGRELRDHRGIIFASLYTIIKNKMGDIFLLGQNQCHITGVKKSYFAIPFI